MKLKKFNLSSQLLILLLASLVLSLMLQMAQAQSVQNSFAQTSNARQAQILETDMPQKSTGRKILDNTSLSYYTQFLGPTVGGPSGQSYNVFQEANTPYQNFHSVALRYKFSDNWAIGASLAAVNAYGETTTSQQNGNQGTMLRDEFFNARAFVSIPALRIAPGTLFTTLSYEAPTSNVAKEDDMQYGLVLTQSFAFNLKSLKWTSGLTWQYYRAFYNENVVPPRNGYLSYARQTTIVNAGPYLGYRFNDRWGMNSSLTFDWDQRGNQTGTGSFNNNLPDRGRVGVSYYPQKIKQISNVGLFTQALLKYRTDSHIVGAELALNF